MIEFSEFLGRSDLTQEKGVTEARTRRLGEVGFAGNSAAIKYRYHESETLRPRDKYTVGLWKSARRSKGKRGPYLPRVVGP